MSTTTPTDKFPCKLLLTLPFPTARLATTALSSLAVDLELSPLVRRSFSISPSSPEILEVRYEASTNRMLRVAVNGFFESVGVVLGVMGELDADVVQREGAWVGEEKGGMGGVQGLV